MIRIVVDSTCDLPADLYAQHHITVVPINIQFGTDSYLDGVTIDRATFYRKIEEMGSLPTTSQPSPGQFEVYYNQLSEAGVTDIISLHVTAKLSGTYHSALQAQAMVADRVQVHPFDSAGGSAGLGFMALEAARMAEAGKSVQEILTRMNVVRDRLSILLTLRDLRFAQMSGRVGKMQSSLASLLDIKPIVLLEDGLIDVIERVRTRRKSIGRMIEMVKERVGTSAPINLAVIHAEVPDEGRTLLETAKAQFECQETFLCSLTTSLVVHFGPGALGLIAYRL
jgi:DegV family protein with EDD domain